jgi:hypothetical protein
MKAAVKKVSVRFIFDIKARSQLLGETYASGGARPVSLLSMLRQYIRFCMVWVAVPEMTPKPTPRKARPP